MPTHDIVVAGAGHNSLITAAYAARCGFDVGVVEAQETIGGDTATEELTQPGFKHDSCSTAHNLIQASPTIKDDELELFDTYGLEYIRPDPVVTIPFDDGTSLTMWRDRERTTAEFAKFSEADAQAYLNLLDDYAEIAPYYTRARYSPPSEGTIPETLAKAPDGEAWIRRSLESPLDILERRFEHPKTRAFLAWMAFMTIKPIDRPGGGLRAFSLTYGRQKNSWVLPRGGSAALPEALESCLLDHGATVYTDQPVVEFLVEDGTAVGVETADGTTYRATQAVVSTVHVTDLVDMIPEADLPEAFADGVKNWKAGLSMFAAHYAAEEPPRYRTEDGDLESVAMGTVGSVENLLDATVAFEKGEIHLDDPFILSLCPSVADDTRAPEGKHTYKLVGVFPYDHADGPETWDERKEAVADALLEHLRTHAPNFTEDVVIDSYVESPLDLERRNPHNYRGSCHGGDYTPDQYDDRRPAAGFSDYRGPVDGLYLTGACTHPGGSVSGAPGRNCATVLLEDLGPGLESGIAKK
ncbi:phytoene desaturase family protein [Natronosalvus caseinilyticus]|uniref:phytoene desaturase family protein n=1 Tax=Natronosalvus caseinilyticus TaxID=2953747 RepID=UPI0028A878FA|nr:NAD(P)/FAD-dependent oxidoreductase [Natronosalvus caseinilyticus]